MTGRRQGVWIVLVALAVFALSFVYRFNTLGGPLAGFDNDHFFQIVRADAMLDGELPLRDYADAELRSLWPPLTYATSAVAMKAMGRTLRSEAVLTVGMLSIGAGLLCWTAATLAQGVLPAAFATLLAVALSPTLYNYPKIVPYVLAVIAMLAYARRPNTWRLSALALIVVVATLYRHDHGVFLSITSGVLLVLVHGHRAVRPVLTFAAFVLLGLTPGLVFAQLHGGAITYLRESLDTSRRESTRTNAAPKGFEFDWSKAWLVRVPAPPVPAPRIAVRWAAPVTPEERARAEQALGLAQPDQRGDDDHNWSYAIDQPTVSRLSAIVRDPRVADTDGIDRQTFALTSVAPAPPPRGGLFGWRIAPGVLQEANAVPWLFLVAWSVVLGAGACLAWPPMRRAVATPGVPSAVVAAVCVLGVMLCIVFLRNPKATRFPDACVPVVLLGAWLLTAIPRAARSHGWPVRVAIGIVLALAVGLTTSSVGTVGAVREQIAGTGVWDAGGIQGQWARVWRTLGTLPDSTSNIDASLGRAAQYLRRCSLPSDRLLVGDNFPEVNYFARRGVAAGQQVFFGGFYTQEGAQRAAIDRWQRQSVPIALMQPPGRFDKDFARNYRLLADYLRAHYRRAGSLAVRNDEAMDVWIDSRRDRGRIDQETGLPCFGG